MIGLHIYETDPRRILHRSHSGFVIRLLGGGEEASKVCNCCMGDSHEPWGIRIGESEGESEGGESRTLRNPYWEVIPHGRVTNLRNPYWGIIPRGRATNLRNPRRGKSEGVKSEGGMSGIANS